MTPAAPTTAAPNARSATAARARITLRCRGGRRCRSRCRLAAEIEFHIGRFLRARGGGEEWPRLEPKHLVQHVGRESFQSRVVLLHRGVEIVSLYRNPGLRSLQLYLQILKRFRRLAL